MSRMKDLYIKTHGLDLEYQLAEADRAYISSVDSQKDAEYQPATESLSESLLESLERFQHDLNLANIHENKLIEDMKNSLDAACSHLDNLKESIRDK